MASANLATPSVPMNTSSTNYYPGFNRNGASREPTPVSSVNNTPTNQSPTSPRHLGAPPHLSFQPLQLRPPKSPLYVPAVLRPTERPSRYGSSRHPSSSSNSHKYGSSPATPPDSGSSSYDSKDGELGDMAGMHKAVLSDGFGRNSITRIVTDEWNDDAMENVTGVPTRDHWKPDSSSNTCNAQDCNSSFTFLNRRHHCRRCGDIFCSPHSPYTVPLDQHARFHPQGSLARACGSCYADFQTWKKTKKNRPNSASTSGSATPIDKKGDSLENDTNAIDKAASRKKKPEVLVGSVPRDWNWSTF